jgi:hypothetical protein
MEPKNFEFCLQEIMDEDAADVSSDSPPTCACSTRGLGLLGMLKENFEKPAAAGPH